ncbi:hypothetical protein [Flavobacterium sp.]|uniref:hypothetical protein n=1 Tax=Flavobacterium sp. TaxID=239 RepID=UPI003D6B6E04
MYIDRIFQSVKALANTDGRGNFKPSTFNLHLYNSILEKFEGYVYDINQEVNRENRGLINGGLENIPDKIRQKVAHFLKSGTITHASGLYALPEDLRYFDTIVDGTDNMFETCKDMNEFNIIKSVNAAAQYPIYIKIGTNIKVAPSTITGNLIIYYLRNPLYPKWTFTVVDNAELFNPSAGDFQDVDMHPSEEDDLVIRVCQKFGISLKEPDLQASMQNQEQIEFNQNKST